MAFIDLQRTVEEIRWSDDPGSKTYRIDFSDDALVRYRDSLDEYRRELESIEDDPAKTGAEDRERLAGVIHGFIATVAGEECYEDALAYVDVNGSGAASCNYMMLGIVGALSDLIVEHLEHAKVGHVRDYLGEEVI